MRESGIALDAIAVSIFVRFSFFEPSSRHRHDPHPHNTVYSYFSFIEYILSCPNRKYSPSFQY